MTDDIKKHITDIVHKYNLAVEQFTEEQFIETLTQMIKAGDFVRYTEGHYPNQRQAVVYVPYHHSLMLRSKIRQLEREIEVLRLYGNKDCTAMADEVLERERQGHEN